MADNTFRIVIRADALERSKGPCMGLAAPCLILIGMTGRAGFGTDIFQAVRQDKTWMLLQEIGLLNKVRDLSLSLISVSEVDPFDDSTDL